MQDIQDGRKHWVEIQQKTFTNWINEELRSTTHEVKDIQTGFQNGLALLALLKSLHTKSEDNRDNQDDDSAARALVPVHENPQLVFRKHENLDRCLNFMKEQKFSGIESTGSSDICDGKLNLILGLVYSLIYRYHIQMKVQGNPFQVSTTSSKSVNVRATVALLSWINWQIHKSFPNMKKIRNLNHDWNDGLALCALIESIKKGACPELPKHDKVENCKIGLKLGSEHFKIPQIISAEHLANPGIDETSVVVYLCYYLQYCFKPHDSEVGHQHQHYNIEQVPRYIVKFLDDVGLVAIPPTKEDLLVNVKAPAITDATQCVADLDFFEQSVFAVGQTIVFTVDCAYGGNRGKLEISATTDANEQIKTAFRAHKKSDRVFDCFVRAETVGTHVLNIRWGEKDNYEHINNSPIKFTVCNAKAVTFDNKQTKYNIFVGDTIELGVDISKAGNAAMLHVEFSDKKMSYKTIKSDGKMTFVYTADEMHKGPSELMVYFNGIKIKTIEVVVASDYLKADPKMEAQATVFTNYINHILKAEEVSNFQWDFQSGVTLACLLKSLSGTEIEKLEVEPENRLQMMQNLKLCFTFMESLKLELHDIKEEHIYNGDGEAILKVLWEIIRFYHICNHSNREAMEESMLIWFQIVLSTTSINNFVTDWCNGIRLCHLIEILEPGLCPQYSVLQASSAHKNYEFAITHAKNHFGVPTIISTDMLQSGNLDNKCMLIYLAFFIQHAMKVLLTWLQTILPDRNITNLTTDWYDGKNVIALCNALCFRVLPTWHALDESQSVEENFANAMKASEENLEISPELFNEGLNNELKNSAYLYCFRYAIERIDAGKCKSLIENQQTMYVNVGDPIKLHLEYNGTSTGEITLYGLNPQSGLLSLRDPVKNQQIYCIESGPTKVIGEYRIAVYWNKIAIPRSPFTIYAGSPKLAIVKSLPDQMTIGEVMVFEIDARQAGNGVIAAKTITPGSTKEDTIFEKIFNHEMVKERYIPPAVGITEFVFTFNGVIIDQQKCTIMPVDKTSDRFMSTYAEYCKLQHKYLSSDHCLYNPNKSIAAVRFSVNVTNAGAGSLTTTVTADGKKSDDIQVNSEIDKSKGVKYNFWFLPQKLLRYTVSVKWNGHEIPGSPFTVNVIEHGKCKPNKHDLPLKPLIDGKYGKAFLNKEIKFRVDTNGAGNGILQSSISQFGHKSVTLTPISISKSGEYTFVYKPCELGRFDIILHYSKTRIIMYPCYTVPTITSGAGIIVLPSRFALLKKSYEFYMEGSPSYTAVIYNPKNDKIKPEKISKSLAYFTPNHTGSYVIFELDNGKCVPNSSSVIQCIDPRECKLLEKLPTYLQVGEVTELKVTTAEAGLGVLSVLVNDKADDEMCTAIVNTQQDNHLCCITLKPRFIGSIHVQILFAGMPIYKFNEPIKVRVCDAMKCEVVMKAKNCLVGNFFSFTLHTAGAGSGKAVVKAYSSNNQLQQTTAHIIKGQNGSLQCTFIPVDVGEHLIDVIWGTAHVPGSPFKIFVEKPPGVFCLAMGSGLNKAIAGKPAIFYITTKDGSLDSKDLFVSIREINHHHRANIQIKEIGTGHCVEYIAPSVGEYVAEIRRCDKEIVFSPFKIDVVQGADASKCKILGVKPEGYAYTNTPLKFSVDTSKGGNGILSVAVKDPNNKELSAYMKQGKNDKIKVTFIAKTEGEHSVSVLWSDAHVLGSPFKLHVCYLETASKVYAHGQGLRNGRLGKYAEFIIETKGAVQENLLTVNGISAENLVEVQTVQYEPGIYKASYKPSCIGDVYINIKWGNNQKHIPGSPFRVCITASDVLPYESVSKSDFQVLGLPLESEISLNTDITYTVSTTSVLQGKVESKIYRPGQRSIILTPINDEGTKFQYRPCEAGRFFITLRYSIIPVGMSPYTCVAISNSSNTSTDIGVISVPDRLALLNKPFTFYIQGSPTYTAIVYNPINKKVELSDQTQSPVAKFFPDHTGSYVIFEEQNHQLIPNSYCIVQCIDPSRCKVLGDLPTYLQVGKSKEFIVTSADAGLGALVVLINGEEDNPLCTAIVSTHQNSRSHKVTLKPRFVGDVSIKLLFEGLTIPQFEEPFKVHICNASKCKVILPNNDCILGEEFTFTLKTGDAGFGKANFRVYHPDHQLSSDAVTIIDNRNGSIQCTYTPVDIGEHLIDVIWGIDHVTDCPFTVMVEKPAGKLCLAIGSGLNRAIVDKPAKFYVTAVNDSLNKRDLDISIRAVKHAYECKVKIDETSEKHYDISYITPKVGQYEAKIKYSDKEIVFSPFKITAVQGADASKCMISGINSQDVYSKDLIEFNVDTSKGGDGTLSVVVTDQYDKQLVVFIKRENDEKHCVAFIPEDEGTHTISVLWSEVHVPMSPLKLNIHGDRVYAYGQGLRSGILGELAVFTVVTKHAGQDDLRIHGFSSKEAFVIKTKPTGDNTYEASYMPKNSEDISISIKWCDTLIPGSPFTVHIISDTTRNTQPVVDISEAVSEEINQNDFEIKGIPLQNNIAYLNTEVSYTVITANRDVKHGALKSYISFSDHKTHTLLPMKQRNREYKFQFMPCKVGKFEIAVCYSNTHLHESPYKCIAIDPSASGVIYISNNIAQVGVPYEFHIQGGHSYSAILYDPQNEKVPNVQFFKEKYSMIARFTPQLTGSYAIFEVSNGQQISETSYTFNCVDPNKCKMFGDLSKFLQVGKAARFKVISRDAGPGDISVHFGDGENNQLCNKTVENSHHVHTVVLKPIIVGSISITVAFSGISIPKTPIKLEICDAYRCNVLGDLTGRYPAGKKISFRLLTAGAGCGKAIIKVQSPTKHPYTVDVIEVEKDVLACAFTPIEIGDHLIYVMWGIEHILGSPFAFTVVESSEVVCISGLEHLRQAIAKVPAKFSIQAKEGGLLDSGALSISIKSVHHEAQVMSKNVGGRIYDVTYIAPKGGSYTAEIKYNDHHIVGSPFKIDVNDVDVTDTAEEDASKCQVTKIRFEDDHYTNTTLEFFIETAQAGDCIPEVTIRDPNNQQVANMFTEKRIGGHVVNFIPEIQGVYTIIVLISSHHVRGSPFKLRCVPRNARMVKAEGEGLHHAKLREWAEFTVDTEDAGQGVLTITAVNRKGPFDIENYLKHEGSSKYIGRYNPQVAGEILITIKWSGVDIPNSPFKVIISDHDGYQPLTAAQRPMSVIVPNPAFIPSNNGSDTDDEDDAPEDDSSYSTASESGTDSDDDDVSSTMDLLHYPLIRHPTQKKSGTIVVKIGDEINVQTTVIQQPRENVNHCCHVLITFIFPPWLIVWAILCCMYGC